ncbi:MAG: hypothetical protein WHS64_01840 [Fervidobacterium sp.]|uniref:Uncharacterized protein n=1 Tax=Fervidobacterium gondwanense DSM 13020 TaxID=1121883 RepID=A0A1M7RWD3_FERGO|nr:hypothetical protein [Fervidobacterium gondwanense]UXF00050.1 hypothetical protein IB67_00170 [Fervidobacterium riparium]SHN50583.1 hypothetical protein SAMN02745226_00261 [Fervidobacterium gondwanense DSM 13020]
MKIFGYVLESYGKYVKVRTQDGEYIIKSDKRPPKEGTKLELKNFGSGDYFAKVVAKKPYEFNELPSVKFVQMAEELLASQEIWNEHVKNRLAIAIGLFLEEVSKRRDIDKKLLTRFKSLLNERIGRRSDSGEVIGGTGILFPGNHADNSDKADKYAEFEKYLNILSGRYGLIINEGLVFVDRELGTFEVFVVGNHIFAKTDGQNLTLYFEKIPDGVEQLERRLKRVFRQVHIKLKGMDDGTYV